MSESRTVREAIIAARERADTAEEEFRNIVRDALTRGASTREIAEALKWSHSTVWRWAIEGKARTTSRAEHVLERSWRAVLDQSEGGHS